MGSTKRRFFKLKGSVLIEFCSRNWDSLFVQTSSRSSLWESGRNDHRQWGERVAHCTVESLAGLWGPGLSLPLSLPCSHSPQLAIHRSVYFTRPAHLPDFEWFNLGSVFMTTGDINRLKQNKLEAHLDLFHFCILEALLPFIPWQTASLNPRDVFAC